MIKIREDSSGKINITSPFTEEIQEETKYPVIIKSTSIKHSIFALRKV
ncbi:MAG: hypothetical protein H0X50_08110 [Nitrosopumilus sp.]|nr:hypothetical protein [Nitrosopumilus sp.]